MKALYLDIFSGISGDMFIGAMLDLGLNFHQFERELAKLGLRGFHLHVSRQQRGQIAGTKFDVDLEPEHDHSHEGEPGHQPTHRHEPHHGHEHSDEGHSHAHSHPDEDEHHQPHERHHSHEEGGHHEHHHGRTFADIKQRIHSSQLSDWVKQRSVAVFQRVANAEGKIHGQPPEEVHFHEVGAVDSIVDIVGACVALEMFDRPRVLSAPVVEGTGWVQCAHGRFPVPTPATLEILGARSVPVSQCEEPHELVTPTGAALLAELVETFGPMRGLTPLKIGYGLGTRENKTRPNVLRAMLCDAAGIGTHDWETDTIAVLQTNLDDTNAELLGSFVEKALAAGALDVFYTPIQMKKSRPAVLLSVLCAEADADKFSELILRETTTFGVRRSFMERRKLRREFATVKTTFGEVTMKIGKLDGQTLQAAPEFQSCRRLAEQHGVPVKQIYEAALRAVKP